MRWSDLDLEAGTWALPPELTKSSRAHLIPLSPLAVETIAALPRQSGDYAFSTRRGELPVSGFSHAKRRCDDISGVGDWRLHDLRRTCATGMAELGVSVVVIGRVLNQAPRGVTSQVYDRYSYLDEKRDALKIWGRKLDAITVGGPDNVVEIAEVRV
jgi:integrase